VQFNVTNRSVLFPRFINARRRIVQPLIDQSNRAGASGKLLLSPNEIVYFVGGHRCG
jgi:hypothetical protein